MSNKEDAQVLRQLASNYSATDAPDWFSTLQRVAAQLESDAGKDEKYEALQAIGKATYESIVDMVAALECDYDRMDELAAERADIMRDWLEANPGADLDSAPPMDEDLKELIEASGECESRDDAEQRIHEDALSVEVRGGWHPYGDQENLNAPEEFLILLGTGGPATRIIGELSDGEPSRARLQAQDWGTAWTDYRGGDSETLLTYCRCFYFGEG